MHHKFKRLKGGQNVYKTLEISNPHPQQNIKYSRKPGPSCPTLNQKPLAIKEMSSILVIKLCVEEKKTKGKPLNKETRIQL